ncbi:MAG: hypothetical protein E6600_15090 [Anaerocolumna aminovalerica]|uniref:hypothetical protein n=1 Tax=Anaerocolumna aminovalerica TaxID=1527 RepID=UPI00290E5949|nr:hypothetical protein [Anaerocolumna aminovalerica]MDU6265819.1 hypothetical protein [Anaerocolumna aminovalerica]
MPDKQSFYLEINEITVFNEEFFKKVYAYSVCDDLFLTAIAVRLTSIGRKDVIQAYNEWFTKWKSEDDKVMIKVAEWHRKECDKKWEKKEKQQRKVMDNWEQRKIQLLTRKKQLLNLLKSTDN